MITVSQLNLSAFPDSPYAAELQRGCSNLRFGRQLELEYVRAHLLDSRRSVQELGIEHRGSRTYSAVTTSIGIAVVSPTSDRNPRGALQLADQALYAAKVGGRNRVELMNEADYRMLVTGVFAKNSRASNG